MTKVIYEYTGKFARPGSVQFAYRPLIEISLMGREKEFAFTALIDSGTEITIMDVQIAELLEIDRSNCESGVVSGIGGERTGFIHDVTFKVPDFEDLFTFGVLFIEDPNKNFDIILGQHDFFKNFKITFARGEGSFGMFTLER